MAAGDADLSGLTAVAAAAASGAGLPSLVRALSRSLGAGVSIRDTAGTALAVAARSSTDEKALSAGGDGVERVELIAGGETVGELRIRRPASAPNLPEPVLALVHALVAAELARSQGGAVASAEASAGFLRSLASRDGRDADAVAAAAPELGLELERGFVLVVVRARLQSAETDGWRERVCAAAWRGARAVSPLALTGDSGRPTLPYAEVTVLAPASEDADGERVAEVVLRELRAGLDSHTFVVGRSRIARSAAELIRAHDEAMLAANVAEGGVADTDGHRVLAFEATGSYRLLLPAMADDPDELRRFYDETIAPIAAYDAQYETNLVHTVAAFLDADGNVGGTAQRLFTHRHTIRYRLERVRELSGFDVASTDGRERLSLGLKAMRVLGISAPEGPAGEQRGGDVQGAQSGAATRHDG